VEPKKKNNNKRPAELFNAEDESSHHGNSDLQQELEVADMRSGSDYRNANALQEPRSNRSDVVEPIVGIATLESRLHGAADVQENGIGDDVLENVRPLDESTFKLRSMVFTTFVPPKQRGGASLYTGRQSSTERPFAGTQDTTCLILPTSNPSFRL
jgi:hypothetical protein